MVATTHTYLAKVMNFSLTKGIRVQISANLTTKSADAIHFRTPILKNASRHMREAFSKIFEVV